MTQGFKKFNKNKPNKPSYIANQFITHQTVRVVGDNIQSDIYPIHTALKMAQDLDLDLVEISPNANPPVCRIISLDKYSYQQKKKKKEQEQTQRKLNGEVKEIRFTSQTDEHDIEFKTKHAISFLQDNNKVKAVVLFKGRNIVHKEFGEDILKNLAIKLEDFGKPENIPIMEGKKLILVFRPKKQ